MLRQQLTRLGRTSFIYSVGGALSGFLNLLLLPVFTRSLSPADYGVIALLNLITLFLVPVLSLGFSTSIGLCYFDPKDPDRKGKTIGTALLILLCVGGAGLLVGLERSGALSEWLFKTPTYRPLVALTLVSALLVVLTQPFMSYLQFEERAKSFTVVAIASTVINLGTSLFLVVVLRRGVRGWVEGTLASQAACFLMFIGLTLRGLRLKADAQVARDLLRLGLPMVPSFLSLYLLLQGNRLILQHTSGLEAVGIYSVGFSLGMIMNMAVSGFQTAWMPYFLSFSDKQEEAQPLFARVFTYYVIGFGTLTVLFYLFAPPLVLLMTRPAFYDSYRIVGPVATAQFFMGIFNLLLPGAYFSKETHVISSVQMVAAGLSLGMNALLIRYGGAFGAGVGLALGILGMDLLQYAWNRSRKTPAYRARFETRRIIAFGLLFALAIPLSLGRPLMSLPREFALSLLGLTIVTGGVYHLLDANERAQLLDSLRLIRRAVAR